MAEQRQAAFNPNDHLMQLKHGQTTSDYLAVQWRLVWFRTKCPQGTIDTEELAYDLDRECEAEVFVWNPEKRRSEKVIKKARGYARYKAVVTDGKGGRATATKSENAASFSEFGEKAETGAVGRALAMLGYGTQFAPELSEEDRIVDAPVDRSQGANNGNGKPASIVPVPQEKATPAPSQEHGATEPQLATIHKLCTQLKQPVPVVATFDEAALWISKFNKQLNENRQKAS